jgi:hypothetical protein
MSEKGPETESIEQKEEPTVDELAQFCQERFQFSDDEASSLVDSGDISAAIATATIILAEKDPDFDEGDFFQSLIEAGLIEPE